MSYRNNATMVAMGMPPLDAFRQMAMKANDPNSMGRHFISHFAKR
ncbi:MAG: hypothetical protein QGH33_14140 [Pirellulaceae bacterium]|nr:hypothetical protein [Pirellulaceae bacterium]